MNLAYSTYLFPVGMNSASMNIVYNYFPVEDNNILQTRPVNYKMNKYIMPSYFSFI